MPHFGPWWCNSHSVFTSHASKVSPLVVLSSCHSTYNNYLHTKVGHFLLLACFLAGLPPPPPPHEVGTRKRLHDQLVTKIDAVDRDILNFHKQNIVRKLLIESHCRGLLPTHPEVIAIVIKYFNLGQQPHDSFANLVERLARTCCGSPLSGLWSHHRSGM